MCTIKIFWGGGGGGWVGGSSERCLKWGGGSLRDLSKNILKQGWVKAKVVRKGEGGGFEGVTTPAPPKTFNHTLSSDMITQFYRIKGGGGSGRPPTDNFIFK